MDATATDERPFRAFGDGNGVQTVFHVSSPAPGDQEHAMTNVANLLDDGTAYEAGDTVAVVANGGGVRMFVAETASAPETVDRLLAADVDLYGCRNALRARDLSTDDLLPGVEAVPSGVGMLVRLQREGYGYVKAP